MLFTPTMLAKALVQKLLNSGGAMEFTMCKPGEHPTCSRGPPLGHIASRGREQMEQPHSSWPGVDRGVCVPRPLSRFTVVPCTLRVLGRESQGQPGDSAWGSHSGPLRGGEPPAGVGSCIPR